MYRITYQGVPLEFINPKSKDELRNVYRFNSKNPMEFPTVAAAQAYANKQFSEILEIAQDVNYPLNLWRRIKAVHYRLEIADNNNNLVGRGSKVNFNKFPHDPAGAPAKKRCGRAKTPRIHSSR